MIGSELQLNIVFGALQLIIQNTRIITAGHDDLMTVLCQRDSGFIANARTGACHDTNFTAIFLLPPL